MFVKTYFDYFYCIMGKKTMLCQCRQISEVNCWFLIINTAEQVFLFIAMLFYASLKDKLGFVGG